MDVHMRIDEAGKDILACGVDHLGVGRRLEVAADPRDRLVLDVDVAAEAGIGGDDLAATDQQGHAASSRRAVQWISIPTSRR
jgi:hypothetical protein